MPLRGACCLPGCFDAIHDQAKRFYKRAVAIDSGGRVDYRLRSHWLAQDNWVGFLVSVVLIVVIGVWAAVIAWFRRRQERREIQQLQAKYSGRDHG